MHTARAKTALDDAPQAHQALQRRLHAGQRQTEAGSTLLRCEWAVGAGVAAQQVQRRLWRRFQERGGKAGRKRHAERIAVARGVLHGDLGHSIRLNDSVTHLVLTRYPFTVELTTAALVIALLLAIPAGISAALHRGQTRDHVLSVVSLFGLSFPAFALGPILILLVSIKLGWLPVSGAGDLSHLILPSVTMGSALAAILTRMVRTSMLEELSQDYIRTARAKGLSERTVVYKHALRNAMIPVMTLIGLQFGALLAGAIVTETIFSWPGIGRLTVSAISNRDYPLLQGCILAIGLTYVLVNLATDVLYMVVNPRIRS